MNPQRQFTTFSGDYNKTRKPTNQFIKAAELGLPKPVVSKETRAKISNSSIGKTLSENHKKILSETAKRNGFGGVTKSRRIKYNGKTLGSSFELQMAKSLDAAGVKWETCGRFKYTDPLGKVRTYTPDFYLPEYDVYLDPKNDFLINNANPALGFTDCEKIKLASEQNGITVFILDKDKLTWSAVSELLCSYKGNYG